MRQLYGIDFDEFFAILIDFTPVLCYLGKSNISYTAASVLLHLDDRRGKRRAGHSWGACRVVCDERLHRNKYQNIT